MANLSFQLRQFMVQSTEEAREGAASTAIQPTSVGAALEASPVRVVGVATLEAFPGRPNYESIKDGDEAEEAWILTDASDKKDQRFQLVMVDGSEQKFATLRRCIGKKVAVEGVVWEAQTGHHHTAHLITVNTVQEMTNTPQPPTAAASVSVSPLSGIVGH